MHIYIYLNRRVYIYIYIHTHVHIHMYNTVENHAGYHMLLPMAVEKRGYSRTQS